MVKLKLASYKVTLKLRLGLIFLIICAAALAVAAVAIVRSVSPGTKLASTGWQCVGCGHQFNNKTTEDAPIECPKCGGQAVRVLYRKCASCGKKVQFARVCLTAQGQAQRDFMKKQAEAQGKTYKRMPMMSPPLDMQFWTKQPDGSFAWGAEGLPIRLRSLNFRASYSIERK